jgi:phage-related protein
MATVTSLMFRMNTSYNGDAMRQARRDIANLDGSIRSFNQATKNLAPGMKDLVATALALGPALVPIAGGLLGIGAAAGSAMVAAGASVGIFSVAMIGAIKSTVGANSAFGATNTAIKTAEKALARTTKGTDEYDKALKKVTQAQKAHEEAIRAMPPVQEKFARAYDKSTVAMSKFNQDNAKFTLGPATTMIEAFTLALPKLNSVIRAISPEIQRVADLTKRWVTDGGLDRFITFIKQYGVPALRGFINATIDLFAALGKGMRDTGPLGLSFVSWLQDTMAAFRGWAEGGGFQRFLAWLQDNKGGLIQAAKDLGRFFSNIGAAVQGMSGAAFTVLGTFFKVLASFPPGLLQAMMYGFIGITAIMKVMAAVMLINAAATTIMALSTGSLSVVMAALMVQLFLVIAVLAAVAVGAYFLVKHWDTVWAAVKSTALAVWGWLKDTWNSLWTGIKAVAMAVWNWLTTGWGQLLLFFMPFGPLLVLMNNWDLVWGTIKSVANAVWQWIQKTWDTIVNGLYTAWIAAIAPIVESWNTVWPGMRDAALNIWNALKIAWNALWTFMKAAWDIFWGAFGPTFTAAWVTIVGVATGVWNTLQLAWQTVWSVIQAIYRTAWAILSGAWNIGWSALTGVAQVAWSILTGAWKVVWSVVTGIWNTFYATFAAIFSAAWNVIVAIATGIWNVIKAAWDALWKSVTAIFMVFTAIFTGNWSAAWNAISAAGQAIWNVMRTAWQAFLNVITTIFNGFVSVIKAAWSAFWTAIQNTATTFWNALRTTFQTFLTAIQNLWNTVWTAVKNLFQTIVNGIMTIAQNWWATFRSAISTFLTFVQNLWNTVWTAIRTFFTTAVNGIRNSAEQLWTWIREIFNTGSNWLRVTFWNPVNNFFTKTIPDAFGKARDALGKAWDGIRKLVRDPIQAIVNVVYNNGIVKLWNLVADVFGAKKLDTFTLQAFAEGGPTGQGSSHGFPAILHPNEHVWTAAEVAGAGGHEAVAKLRSQAMNGARVRTYGEHSFKHGGGHDDGFLGTGIGPDIGPDLIPDGIIKNAFSKLKDLALGAIYGPFSAAVDGVAKLGKTAVRAAIPGSNSGMEQLGVGMIDKIATTIKEWVKQNDVAPEIGVGGNGFIPWRAWKAGDGNRQNYGGVTVNRRTAAMLSNAVKIAKTGFSMFQGSYSNAVAASGGTHSGGGAVDLGPAKDAIVGAMRASGFAAWRRTPAEGFSPHIHGIAVGDPTVSAAAAAQVRDFHRGLNGLAGGGKDTYTAPGGGKSGQSVSAAKATGKSMLGSYGWSSHWSALEALWNRESGWRWNADNPSSDAYGIPQALPGSKMKSAGADWKTNPATQIRWGLGYIRSRYGTPTAANNFQRANNWYGRGTRDAHPGVGIVGDRGLELMRMRGGEDITPLGDLVGSGGSGEVNLTLHIDARGATASAVDKLNNELPDRLRMALEQHVGSRP